MVRATVVSMVAALLVGTTGAYVVMTGLVRRIAALADNVDRLLRGEPLRRPPASADEIGQLTDVTLHVGELLAQRRELAESATRAKDQFLSRVSQELETPLTTMIAVARGLDEDPDVPARSRGDARHIARAGQQLHGPIAEMLDIKAIEAGRLALTIEAVPIDVVAHEAVSLVRPTANERAVAIETDCPSDLTVAADRRRLREVLLNLLSNAVKYNRPGGRVELAASRHDTSVRISVRDTGPGIAANDRSHLFEPFERLDAAGTGVEGSGLGLALTKRVVHAMHGTIGVESAVGRGSTFWFDLPAAGGAAPVRSASGPVAHDG
jgi:signal transduction histidine kinase